VPNFGWPSNTVSLSEDPELDKQAFFPTVMSVASVEENQLLLTAAQIRRRIWALGPTSFLARYPGVVAGLWKFTIEQI